MLWILSAMISNDVLAAGMHAFIFIAPYKHAHTCLLMCGDMTTLCLTARLTSHTPFPSMHSGASGIRHQMAACLAQLPDSLLTEQSNSPAMQRLSELVIECGSLIVITLISNPKGFKDLQNCNMDEGMVCTDAQPPLFYCEVMVICNSV